MSYTPTTWANGDTITAVKLNNMESGISNAGGLVAPVFTQVSEISATCDMTFSQVNAAINAGKCFYAKLDETIYQLTEYVEDDYHIFGRFSVGGGVFLDTIICSSDGSITLEYNSFPE